MPLGSLFLPLDAFFLPVIFFLPLFFFVLPLGVLDCGARHLLVSCVSRSLRFLRSMFFHVRVEPQAGVEEDLQTESFSFQELLEDAMPLRYEEEAQRFC